MRKTVVLAAVLCLLAFEANAKGMNVAAAHCRITGATGHGTSSQSIGDAMQKAIADCVGQGGIPACCKAGAYPVSQGR